MESPIPGWICLGVSYDRGTYSHGLCIYIYRHEYIICMYICVCVYMYTWLWFNKPFTKRNGHAKWRVSSDESLRLLLGSLISWMILKKTGMRNCALLCRQAKHVFHVTDWVNLGPYVCSSSPHMTFVCHLGWLFCPCLADFGPVSNGTTFGTSVGRRIEERGVVVGYSDPSMPCRPCDIDMAEFG